MVIHRNCVIFIHFLGSGDLKTEQRLAQEMENKPIIIIVTQYYYGNHMFRGINHFPYIQAISLAMSILVMISGKKEMWTLNKCIFYVQIQAAKPVYSDSSLDKLFCLTNRKSGNQLW